MDFTRKWNLQLLACHNEVNLAGLLWKVWKADLGHLDFTNRQELPK